MAVIAVMLYTNIKKQIFSFDNFVTQMASRIGCQFAISHSVHMHTSIGHNDELDEIEGKGVNGC